MRVVKMPNFDLGGSILDLESSGVGSSPTAFNLQRYIVTVKELIVSQPVHLQNTNKTFRNYLNRGAVHPPLPLF